MFDLFHQIKNHLLLNQLEQTQVLMEDVAYIVQIDEDGNPTIVSEDHPDIDTMFEDQDGISMTFLRELLDSAPEMEVTNVEYNMDTGEFNIIGREDQDESDDEAAATTTGGDGRGRQ